MVDIDRLLERIERTVGTALQSTPRTVRLCVLLLTVTFCTIMLLQWI